MTYLLSSPVTVIYGFSLNNVLRARAWKSVTEELRVRLTTHGWSRQHYWFVFLLCLSAMCGLGWIQLIR